MIMVEDTSMVAMEAGVGTVTIGLVVATWIANQVDMKTLQSNFGSFCRVGSMILLQEDSWSTKC